MSNAEMWGWYNSRGLERGDMGCIVMDYSRRWCTSPMAALKPLTLGPRGPEQEW